MDSTRPSRSRPLLLIVPLATLALVACSSGNKKPEYYNASETSPLQIPEDLDTPDQRSALTIDAPPMPSRPVAAGGRPRRDWRRPPPPDGRLARAATQ